MDARFERYIENLRTVRTLSQPKFSPDMKAKELLETIQSNAIKCFDCMKEDNAILNELVLRRAPAELTSAEIASLQEFADKMFDYASSEDCGIAYKTYSRLLDEEFACIQWHTVFGYELLCNVGGKDDLAPAALYHHTFYDGHGGYPKNYPPCPAGIKPIVDALTVADSLDAATDNIGRCYTMAKPVDRLLGEFHAQRGTRYAPEVVALLDDEDFCRDLKETLDETRKSVYLEVYHVKR